MYLAQGCSTNYTKTLVLLERATPPSQDLPFTADTVLPLALPKEPLSRLPNGQMLTRWLSEKKNLSVFRLRFRGAKKVKKCCMFCILYSPAITSIYPLYRSISRFLRYFVHAPFTDCLHYQLGQGILSLSILLKISVKACGKYIFMIIFNKFTTYFQEK